VIVVNPTATVVAMPPVLMVATELDEELHVTPLDKSWLLPSL
jgi:hypothetical protein